MLRVGIVGAGLAGATAAFELRRSAVECEVSLFERRARTGGRAGTGRVGDLTYDYGANYISSDDARVNAVLDAVVPAERRAPIAEPVYTIDADGEIAPGRESTSTRWSCTDGIQTIPDELLARAIGTVHLETVVDRLERRGDGWRIHDDSNGTWGPFDAIVVTTPPADAATIFDRSESSSIDAERIARLREIPFKRVVSAVLRYPFEIDVPYYALLSQTSAHPIDWIARESCKAGHVPDGETALIVQAGDEWSREHFEAPSDGAAQRLADHCREMMGLERIGEPAWSRVHRWRNAIPLAEQPMDHAINSDGGGCFVAGDWTVGDGRLENAMLSGLRCADRILERE
jgi:predicted NAD/FAD-dependent oxidoreductase